MLNELQGHELVQKTRNGIEAHLDKEKAFEPGPRKNQSELWKRRGVFVTIIEYDEGRLRGCIGNPRPTHPLLIEAIRSGILAATADPRFEPLSLRDLQLRSCLELTVLSPLELVEADKKSQLPDHIAIGSNGVMVEGLGRQGLLLPQVAIEEKFDCEDLLSNCCLKAGLTPDAWLSGNVKVFRFTGQIFAERTPGQKISGRRLSSQGVSAI